MRNTYVEIDLNSIKENVETIINKYPNYDYYFGVVKADCYGHYSNEVVKSIIKGGCNYLAVSSLEEALEIRKEIKDIPILCLGIIDINNLQFCENNNITITIPNYKYLKSLENIELNNLKVHIKLDTGMKRLGIDNQKEFEKTLDKIKELNLILEGIYTHIYKAEDKKTTYKQFDKFKQITKNINLKDIPITHITASRATVLYPKLDFVNGCRLGIIMYGFDKDFTVLKSTFKLISEIIEIKHLKKGETLGYEGEYKATKNERIAIIPIGYGDGIIRENKGRGVYINNKEYEIVGNICMDMLFVKIDSTVKIKDKVEIIKDVEHIKKIAKHLNTIEYEILCNIGKRVPRIYK